MCVPANRWLGGVPAHRTGLSGAGRISGPLRGLFSLFRRPHPRHRQFRWSSEERWTFLNSADVPLSFRDHFHLSSSSPFRAKRAARGSILIGGRAKGGLVRELLTAASHAHSSAWGLLSRRVPRGPGVRADAAGARATESPSGDGFLRPPAPASSRARAPASGVLRGARAAPGTSAGSWPVTRSAGSPGASAGRAASPARRKRACGAAARRNSRAARSDRACAHGPDGGEPGRPQGADR
jgi:hypothetical protein